MRITYTLAMVFLVLEGPHANGETLWVDLMGKGQDTYLRIEQGWPLLHFAKNQPYWSPTDPSNPPELEWRPLSRLANVESLGHFGGFPVYEITYSPVYRVIVWDKSDWSFCPLVIIAGDESIVARIYRPERVIWQDKEILHLRIQLKGTGTHQQSLFFSVVDGPLVPLRPDYHIFDEVKDIEVFHRGGGFCMGTLTYQVQAWRVDAAGNPIEHGVFRTDYKVEGNRLVVQKTGLVVSPEDVLEPCELYPQ